MSDGKNDFLDYDDEGLDLGALLGEYTCFKVEFSDEDDVQNTKSLIRGLKNWPERHKLSQLSHQYFFLSFNTK